MPSPCGRSALPRNSPPREHNFGRTRPTFRRARAQLPRIGLSFVGFGPILVDIVQLWSTSSKVGRTRRPTLDNIGPDLDKQLWPRLFDIIPKLWPKSARRVWLRSVDTRDRLLRQYTRSTSLQVWSISANFGRFRPRTRRVLVGRYSFWLRCRYLGSGPRTQPCAGGSTVLSCVFSVKWLSKPQPGGDLKTFLLVAGSSQCACTVPPHGRRCGRVVCAKFRLGMATPLGSAAGLVLTWRGALWFLSAQLLSGDTPHADPSLQPVRIWCRLPDNAGGRLLRGGLAAVGVGPRCLWRSWRDAQRGPGGLRHTSPSVSLGKRAVRQRPGDPNGTCLLRWRSLVRRGAQKPRRLRTMTAGRWIAP